MDFANNSPIMVENFESTHRTLRIAVVTETWPPEVNGVALTLSKLVAQLSIKNHSIQLIRPQQNKQDTGVEQLGWSELLLRGLPIPRYPQLKLGLPSKKALVKAWTLRRPDLVHIATEGPLCWSALQAAQTLRLPITSDFRTNFHSYCQHYGLSWLHKPVMSYLRKFHNRTLCTMVPTQSLKAELQAAGFQNLKVVSRGIDTQVFNPNKRSESLRESWGAGVDDVVLLSVGRLAAEKNLDLVVDTYQALINVGRKVILVFAGDGPLRNTLNARCPDAIFMGLCSQDQLATIYASADLFVFASLTETFGNVTLEALASGTPALAFDCAAAGELIQDGHNGWLCSQSRSEDFIARALEVTHDRRTLSRARTFARSSVESIAWNEITNQVESIFIRAIELNETHELSKHSARSPQGTTQRQDAYQQNTS